MSCALVPDLSEITNPIIHLKPVNMFKNQKCTSTGSLLSIFSRSPLKCKQKSFTKENILKSFVLTSEH